MKPALLLFLALGSLFALSVQGQQSSHFLEDVEHVKSLAKGKFTCPETGVFPDPDDCSYYHMCLGKIGARRRCQGILKFDSVTKRCMNPWFAVCFGGKTKSTTSTPSKKVTKSVTSSTSDDATLVCSSFMGTFAHPNDCSKYYSCMMFIPSVKKCPEKKLFDAVKKSCKSEGDVHCGTRKRPAGYTTTEIPAKSTTITMTSIDQKSTTTGTTITSKPTDVVSVTTETLATVTSKTPDVVSVTTETLATISSKPPEVVSTTETTVTTKEVRPTGPPDHNCDENDLDCIITETGDAKNWFTCPDDIGSYPHPSSDKLFIFCMNWTPSAKKCGVDLVFSKELLTCVNSLYLM